METIDRSVTFYRVDVPKAIRKNEVLRKEKFKEEVKYSRAHQRDEKWRLQMGNLGLIEKSDFETGNYRPYGLDEDRIQGVTKIEKLEDANMDLQLKIAELEAQLKNSPTTDQPKKDKDLNTTIK